MDSHIGKAIRLGRVLRPETGRTVIVAASHGVLTGPPPGQVTRKQIETTFSKLSKADGVMVAPGMLRVVADLFTGRNRPALIIELDWKSWNRPIYSAGADGRGEGATAQLASLEDLLASGVDAVMTYMYVGQLDSSLERAEIERNARIARECSRWGIGLIIEPRSAREDQEDTARSSRVISFAARVAAEIGADLVKVIAPEDGVSGLEQIVDSCFAPVVLAGGPGVGSIEEVARIAGDAVRVGAAGVMFGRKIYSAPDPEKMIDSLIEAVHGQATK